ncbi:acylphosphatase [Candidatus Berkiella aquae]|uniref:Acylphosphatase n=3 Tax=Candidatus Berkiella aquae TaxID=295108 RepID=A0AAE3HUM5_9GAMM|nr:acylphosphatase [Candidatus Berkiella aquae]
MMKSCRRCVISGRVQGVYFRQGTLEQAEKCGVKGWVRNLNNGDVECVICGDNEALEQLMTWLHQGPPSAHVVKMESSDIPWEEHTGFSIRR